MCVDGCVDEVAGFACCCVVMSMRLLRCDMFDVVWLGTISCVVFVSTRVGLIYEVCCCAVVY